MTSFTTETKTAESESAQKTTEETKEQKQEAEKAEEQTKELVSRLKPSPQVWNDALKFCDMLTFCRPHKSRTEHKFIGKYLAPLGVKFDTKGNMYKQIGNSPVLWSSHVDTVHGSGGRQKIVYWVDKKSGDTFFGVDEKVKSSCLGADDTTGVWLMLEMIRAKVPGLYIFHRGEECGGIGSKWISEHNKKALDNIKFAIAFDRRDTGSIITFQRSTRCCSDEFANSLAEQLGLGHKCDDTGLFTDTASYVDHIPECTNVSVGYYDAHSKSENVNLDYLFRLRDAVCKLDVSKLVEKRKKGENDRKVYTYSGVSRYYTDYNYDYDSYWDKMYGSYSRKRPEGARSAYELNHIYGYQKWYKWFEWRDCWWFPIEGVTPPDDAAKPQKDVGVTKGWKQTRLFRGGDRPEPTATQLKWLIQDNPAIVADLLDSFGYGPKELRDYIETAGGTSLCGW